MRYRCPNPRTILVIEMTPPLIRVPSPCLPDHPVAVKAVTEEPIGTMVDHVTLRDEMRNFIHRNADLQQEVEHKSSLDS